MTLIHAIVSKKGGVGKTTTSVNLAAGLARRGLRVLLVDLDPNAGATLSLGLEKKDIAGGTADYLLRDRPLDDLLVPTKTEGLVFLPATVDLRSAEVELDAFRRKERVLRSKLEGERHGFDHVVIDCPSSIGLLTRNAIAAADGVIVPSVPHFLAVEGLEHLMSTVERLAWRNEVRHRYVHVLITLADYRSRATRTTVDRIRSRFGKRVFATEVRINTRLAEAPGFGQTVFEFDDRSTGAQAYEHLAEELEILVVPSHAAEPALASVSG